MCNLCMAAAEETAGIEVLKAARKINVKYRSQTLHDLEIDGMLQEIETRLSAWLKGLSITSGDLHALDMEDMLGIGNAPPIPNAKVIVHGDLFNKWEAAREKLKMHSKAQSLANADDMVALMKSTSAGLTLEDDCWRIEKGVLAQIAGPAAETRMVAKIAEWFPAADRDADVDFVLGKLNAEVNKASIRFVPQQVKDGLTVIIGWLTAIKASSPVNIASAHMVPLVQEAARRLQYFLTMPKEGTEGGVVRGAEAMEILIDALTNKAKQNTAKGTNTDLIIKFKWLVPSISRELVQMSIDAAKAKDKEDGKAVVPSAGGSSSSSGKTPKSEAGKKASTFAQSFFE